MSDSQPGEPVNRDDALSRIVGSLRDLIELAVTAEAPDEALAVAEQHVTAAVAALAPYRRAARRSASAAPEADPAALMPFDPVVGALSPLAPPLRVRWEPPMAVGEITVRPPYEGPPGCVHGGFIAAAFDQVFNVANIMAGTPGPTARLRLHYRRPTPLGTALRFEAWREAMQGRRIHLRGRLLAGEHVTVEAEGIFAVVPIERILRMLAPDDDCDR